MNETIKQLPALDDDLIEILGRPNFHCGAVANALRLRGHNIPFKSETEQATVLHFTLNHYLQDPVNWRDRCRNGLLEGFVQKNERMAFDTVMHMGNQAALITVKVLRREGIDKFPETFTFKGIFPSPYTLETGIFYEDGAVTTRAILDDLSGGALFDTSRLREGWMDYETFFKILDLQYEQADA